MMKPKLESIIVEGIEYVPKTSLPKMADKFDGLEYKIVRTKNAGVFAGYVKDFDENKYTLIKARRLWYWDGAASLSQLAMEGVSKPDNCKFPCEVEKVELFDVIEILDVSEKAKESINNVKIWSI
jgi:hypothetical protein